MRIGDDALWVITARSQSETLTMQMAQYTRFFAGKLREKMLIYIRNRFLQLIPVLLGITFLSFALMHSVQGDAVDMVFDQAGMAVSDAVKTKMRADLGLDQPFLVQYTAWLSKLARGDMGTSLVSGREIFPTFISKLPQTIYLAVVSMLLTLVLALPLGIMSALQQNKLADRLIRFCGFVGNSLPNFFVALLLILLFSVKLHWFAAAQGQGWNGIILPSLTLALAMAAKYMRQIRTAVLEEMHKDYVIAAQIRGIPRKTIFYKSILHVVLINVVTLMALSLGSLLGGTAIVESIYMWDGVGRLAVEAIRMRDYPMIQAYVVWLSLIYMAMNLAADILYRYLDPRLREVE